MLDKQCIIPLLLSFLAGLSTVIGAFIVFFSKSGFRQFQINKMPSKSLYISFFPSNFLKKFVVYVVY